jgi:UDP-glucose 4-epimerase
MENSNKTVLVTGCAGLLGSRMVDWLIERGACGKIIGIDDLSGGYMKNVNKKIDGFYKFNLSYIDSSPLDVVFNEHRPDVVYHFAAYAAEGLSPFIRQFNYSNNLVATAGVVNKCIEYEVEKLVFTSSMAVYGDQECPFTEDQLRIPIDPYGVAKSACERDIEIAGEQHGLNYTIIRPHNVYGIKQNIWDRYRNVLGIWMNQHLQGLPLTIFGDGGQKRAFSYIDDCLEPLWKAYTNKETNGEIINLGGTSETSIEEACDTLIEVMGGGIKSFLQSRHEVKYAWSSHQKSIDLLSYKDKTNLKEGLECMWGWAKNESTKASKNMPYEIKKGLYEYWKT